MADNVRELRPKTPDSEKITINLGYVDLGHIDLMVQDGFYSNRTDFIRTAIRNQLDRQPTLSSSRSRGRSWTLGCGTTPGKSSKPYKQLARRLIFRFWGSLRSRQT